MGEPPITMFAVVPWVGEHAVAPAFSQAGFASAMVPQVIMHVCDCTVISDNLQANGSCVHSIRVSGSQMDAIERVMSAVVQAWYGEKYIPYSPHNVIHVLIPLHIRNTKFDPGNGSMTSGLGHLSTGSTVSLQLSLRRFGLSSKHAVVFDCDCIM